MLAQGTGGDNVNLQFAVLWNGARFESWQLSSLDRLRALATVRATLVIRSAEPAASAAPLPEILSALPIVGAGELSARSDLDFILSFTDEPCSPDLLEAARYGVWAYRFGRSARNGSEAAGFWEVYRGAPVTTGRLVRLQASPESVVVLREGHIHTHPLSFAANRRELLARAAGWPALVCTDIGNGVTARFDAPALVSASPRRAAPTSRQRLGCRVRIAARTVRVVLKSLFRHDQWNVGYVERPISWFLDNKHPMEVAWLEPSSRDAFLADPFGTWRDGRLTILCEHFSYRSNRGTIVAIESARETGPTSETRAATETGAIPVDIGPQPAVHLSYPYLFEAEGRLLCIPESYEAAEIGLYEIGRFPDRWIKVANLIEGPSIVDATLFRYQDRWWLAGSEATAMGTCELHLWHAEQISGPWQPHAANPVKVDVRSARPAGTPFLHNGALYRPAQDCSRTYGGRVVINRVITLTPTEFLETPAATVEPDPSGPYPAGLHTLSAAGSGTLIDGKRVIFSPAEFRRVLRHYLRAVWRRARG